MSGQEKPFGTVEGGISSSVVRGVISQLVRGQCGVVVCLFFPLMMELSYGEK